eukprot:CAMPEP_0197684852 /NCGR_PEP_ID=MMETSP1338-20131121/100053_1 /TAXON_ID=43686 ORGANISM="Pelagodinium beii, Strain RCC1491" /NCGR_SAMPLE_ID=MMETSP1338 /ASSEMBLY_ACC=CAM_ASM_000754 /LENGTH=87 /DNA_ID=CAMNT_0043266609 /DNA_START=20 /DNA_END=280 /DNA_ORIENTATION=+
MMRPPSREDVQTAQSHLVLLKSKMRQRRHQEAPPLSANSYPGQRSRAEAFDRAPSAGAVSGDAFRGVTWDPPTGSRQTPTAGRRPQP